MSAPFYLGFVLWAIARSVLKLIAYRRGLQPVVMSKPTRITNSIRAPRFTQGEMTRATMKAAAF